MARRWLPFICALALVARAQTAGDLFAAAERVFGKEGARAALPGFQRALETSRNNADQAGEARALNAVGICYRNLGDPKAALEYFQQSLAIKQRLGDRIEEAKTINNIGLAQADLSEHRRALANYHRALAMVQALKNSVFEGRIENNIGASLLAQGDYIGAREHLQRALSLNSDNADALENMGGSYQLMGRCREAVEYYQRALQLNRGAAGEGHALGNVALAYLGLGQIGKAVQYYDEAIAIAIKQGSRTAEADWRKGKGSALRHAGRFDDALAEYRQAVAIYEAAQIRQKKVEALGDIGYLHLAVGDAVEAEKRFQNALALARSIRDHRGVMTNLVALGDLASRRKLYPEALKHYRSALQSARSAGDQAVTASTLAEMSLLYRQQGRLAEAAREANAALAAARETGAKLLEAQALYALGEASRLQRRLVTSLAYYTEGEAIAAESGETELEWRLAFGVAQTLEALGRTLEAIRACRRAADAIDMVRVRLREERFRSGYFEDKNQVYVFLVDLLLRQRDVAEAFSFAERLHARAHAELIINRRPRVHSAEEAELRERIRQLQEALAREDSRMHEERRSEIAHSLSRELIETERQYTNLLDDLRAADPAYAAAAITAPPLKDVQRSLPAGTALIEYVVAEDRVLAFVLTGHGIHGRSLRIRLRDLNAKVELLRDLIARPPGDEWRAPAESLAQLLIQPLRSAGWLNGVRWVYIVPHRLLHSLPFAALPAGARPLGETYAIAYLPAAGWLVQSDSPRSTNRGKSLLAFAPGRAALTHAAEEARAVGALFPRSSAVLTGANATEAAFKRDAPDYDILHLATHGSFDALNPMLSALVLEPGAGEDGKLNVGEILDMRLNARLVILSACSSAMASGYFSQSPAGDDFIGLTRAFLYAGGRAVVATLWAVDDLSTAVLMGNFYSGMRTLDKATALAAAQSKLRARDAKYQHPYYWAPFMISGKMD